MGLLSTSNTKLGRVCGFAISTKSCGKYRFKKHQGCKEYCYARKIENLRPRVKAKWEDNLKRTKRKDFVEKMADELSFSGDFIRVHVSGDFYSQEYLNKWCELAWMFQHKTFLVYTKAIDLDFSKRPENLRVILSDDQQIWSPLHKYFDGVATMQQDKKYFTCPYVEKRTTCDECMYCLNADRPKIFFKKH